MLPGDRLVCAFVEPQTVGARFQTWLLHVTIVPWFRLPDTSEAVAHGLAQALTAIEPFDVAADGTAMFGPDKTRRVWLLQESTPLTQIEQKVRTYLHEKQAFLIDETTKRPPNFCPHVTEQRGFGLRAGDSFRCAQTYIVEQRGTYKEVVAVASLSGLHATN